MNDPYADRNHFDRLDYRKCVRWRAYMISILCGFLIGYVVPMTAFRLALRWFAGRW